MWINGTSSLFICVLWNMFLLGIVLVLNGYRNLFGKVLSTSVNLAKSHLIFNSNHTTSLNLTKWHSHKIFRVWNSNRSLNLTRAHKVISSDFCPRTEMITNKTVFYFFITATESCINSCRSALKWPQNLTSNNSIQPLNLIKYYNIFLHWITESHKCLLLANGGDLWDSVVLLKT